MKRTLLDLTQSVLSSMSSDEVNSIGDTTESLQVAEIIKTSYFNILGRFDLTKHNQLFQLQPSNDSTQPILMYKPDGVGQIDRIRYYTVASDQTVESTTFIHDLNLDITTTAGASPAAPAYRDVVILPIDDFLNMVNSYDSNSTTVDLMTLTIPNAANGEQSPFKFLYRNDKTPQYCTVLQNYYIVFDSFDSSVDSTLQANKTMCEGWVIPEWEATDTFVPDLDDQQFAMLLNEAKSLAFFELKQMPHSKAEQEVKRQASSIQKFNSLANKPSYFDQLPNFGRGRTR